MMRIVGKYPQHQRGVALVLVLWAIALMAVLLGSFALIAHTEQLESRHVFDAVTARYDAQAGLERAVFELRNTDPAQRWVVAVPVHSAPKAGGRPSLRATGAALPATVGRGPAR